MAARSTTVAFGLIKRKVDHVKREWFYAQANSLLTILRIIFVIVFIQILQCSERSVYLKKNNRNRFATGKNVWFKTTRSHVVFDVHVENEFGPVEHATKSVTFFGLIDDSGYPVVVSGFRLPLVLETVKKM